MIVRKMVCDGVYKFRMGSRVCMLGEDSDIKDRSGVGLHNLRQGSGSPTLPRVGNCAYQAFTISQ